MTEETRIYDDRGRVALDGELLQVFVTGYALSAALGTAASLDLFAAVAEPRELGPLATELGVHPDGLERLLGTLCAMGLVRRHDDGRFEGRSLASVLSSTHPNSLRPTLLAHRRLFYDLMGGLEDAVRTGATQLHRWPFARAGAAAGLDCYELLERSPEHGDLFWEVMNRDSVGVGTFIAEHVDLTQVRRVADLGGGGGRVAIELARALPRAEVVVVDREAALRVARQACREQGLHDRMGFVEADLLRDDLRDVVGSVDAVVLGGVLSDFDDARREEVFARACSLLPPGGWVLVSETLLDDDRGGPLVPSLLDLLMLTATGGRNLTAAQVRDLFEQHEVTLEQVVQGGSLRDLVVGRTSATP